MKLRSTQFGFDLTLDNPFRIFRYLREVAIESVGEENIVDLSRGDPGYGFSPSVPGREFYSFLLNLDTMLNRPGEHFVTNNRDSFEVLWEKIEARAYTLYIHEAAERLLNMLRLFLETVKKIAASQGVTWNKRKILFEVFKYSAVSGGQYHDPQGELLTRLIVSDHHNKTFGLGITHRDLVFIRGVSDGIGTLFKLLCSNEVGFLQKGDTVLITSPVYAPYNTIMKNRGLEVFSIPMNAETGEVNGNLEEILAKAPQNVKAICIIDPNNPTGFLFPEALLKRLAEFAQERNALIIADEVYGDFFPGKKKSMLTYAPKRTITMLGRSKIERSTGLRFAEYVVTQEGDRYISEEILKGRLNGASDLKSLFIAAKAPGGINGEFQHTTFVAGPSQFLGISHILFGESDRANYVERVQKNMEAFYEGIGLPYRGNFYYATFDLSVIPDSTHGAMRSASSLQSDDKAFSRHAYRQAGSDRLDASDQEPYPEHSDPQGNTASIVIPDSTHGAPCLPAGRKRSASSLLYNRASKPCPSSRASGDRATKQSHCAGGESLFLSLAQKGVVLIPANLFFSDSERAKKDYRTFARASLANLNLEQVHRGAKLIRDFSTVIASTHGAKRSASSLLSTDEAIPKRVSQSPVFLK